MDESARQDLVLQAMNRPETYPDRPQKIIHLQTYISHIFLTGRRAYKIKKPVTLDFLDFSTLARRRYYCQKEVALNRRLAPEIYLGVSRITWDQGRPIIGGKGPILEYAVTMAEMPQERMMNRLLKEGKVTPRDIRDLVRILVPFYRRAAGGKAVAAFGRIEVLRKNTEENFQETRPFVGDLFSTRRFETIVQRTRSFLEAEKFLFQKRIQEGYIREGHGDLHSGNICLDKTPKIYDCIEFNSRFRCGDVAGDLAFLAMDLDFHGRPDLARLLRDEYVHWSGDRDFLRIFGFYLSYRAYVRAKVHALASVSPEWTEKEKRAARRLARRYFDLAYAYTQEKLFPNLWVVMGLMGSGKSTLARAISQATGWTIISSDASRKALLGIRPQARVEVPFEKGIYAPKVSARTYRHMRNQAQRLLRQGRSVILDGSYKRQEERLALIRLARQTGAHIRFLYCSAPEEVIRKRLENRKHQKGVFSDGRWELFHQQKEDFDPLSGPVLSLVRTVSTLKPAKRLVQTLLSEFGRTDD